MGAVVMNVERLTKSACFVAYQPRCKLLHVQKERELYATYKKLTARRAFFFFMLGIRSRCKALALHLSV